MKELVILYSGGTDSTCAAALMAKEFDKIHLLSYTRFGVFSIENSKKNVERLVEKFGKDKFIHKIIDVDKIFRKVSYSNYMHNLRKHKFVMLTMCGLCKITLHIRSLMYCLDNDIKYVCDGVDKSMVLFPTHMREVVGLIKDMYFRYGIIYSLPVYECGTPRKIGYFDKYKLDLNISEPDNFAVDSESNNPTTGEILHKMGIFPSDNIKGTKLDHQMQYRCFQFILTYILALWYYLPKDGYEKYKDVCIEFYKEKINYFYPLLDEYFNKKESSSLARLR
ncbi:MAG: hypothetical protein K9L86_00525 [Candidatus Omnitrophica bacterium]|nr:hypothetical protein [Candidatus Omnitrophota bacterium]